MEKKFRKCLILGVMVMVFWVCSFIVNGIVRERKQLSEAAQTEISESWCGVQTFAGPIICVPEVNEASVSKVPFTCVNVLPEQIEVNADMQSEVLHRGMFDAPVYRSKISGKGVFTLSEMLAGGKMSSVQNGRYDWSRAQIIVGVKSKLGLEDGIKVKIGNINVVLKEQFNNYGNTDIVNNFANEKQYYENLDCVCQIVDLTSLLGLKEIPFEVNFDLRGSESLDIATIGQTSVITMIGNSDDPKFNGLLLPSTREVSDNGYSATWKVSSLNCSNINQYSYLTKEATALSTVGTEILVCGGQYTQTDRAIKYAFLVLLLSLSAVFVAELCVKTEINLMNYFLIGCALVLFYLMLLCFGEWVGFSISYVISAILILGMIAIYLKAIVKKNMVALSVCSFMALIDVFIFILLSIESMALLVGTLGLFVLLGVAMFFSLRFANETKEPVQKPVSQ